MYPKLKMKCNKLKKQHPMTILTVIQSKQLNSLQTSTQKLKSKHNKVINEYGSLLGKQNLINTNKYDQRKHKHYLSPLNQRKFFSENEKQTLKEVSLQNNQKIQSSIKRTRFPSINQLSSKYNHLRGKRRSYQFEIQLYKQNRQNQNQEAKKTNRRTTQSYSKDTKQRQYSKDAKQRQNQKRNFSKKKQKSKKNQDQSQIMNYFKINQTKNDINTTSEIRESKYNFIFNHNRDKIQNRIINDALRCSINGWKQFQSPQKQEEKWKILQQNLSNTNLQKHILK